ncbi:LysR family transcriptional regulator [Brevibacterium marinum]|uniref:DNA-binding transcriptional LysR family regulator n=1 Tax=Brevibacterium marinum TaxID=418643 RepID=A0A846S378_9MICO|nr:LysR family transcriptional regulator [Brevibacterium marinum]NJC55992.1 DNA-binding transcriptional LysR family regulator [Brevibacterium marinum]
MYDLHRLRLLRELSHRETLAAVAEALGYSPSAISHQLGLLERETGTRLLEPSGRRVRLTAAAVQLVAHTETILRELERAEADIAASRTTITGTVHIATFQTAAQTLVLDVIQRLALHHPRLTVTFAHVDAEAAIPALIARDYDLVLSEQYPGNPQAPHPGVSSERVLDDPLLLAIPAGWSARTLADLAEKPWVMERPGTAARAWSTATCRAAGYEPEVPYETSDLNLHSEIVDSGLAAAFLPRLAYAPSRSFRTVSTDQLRIITASTRSGGDRNPAVNAFRRALKQATAAPR